MISNMTFFCVTMILAPPLAMTNLHRKKLWDTQDMFFSPTEISSYVLVRNSTSNHMLKEAKTLTIWTNSLLVMSLNTYKNIVKR
jgi:hypothetical protein